MSAGFVVAIRQGVGVDVLVVWAPGGVMRCNPKVSALPRPSGAGTGRRARCNGSVCPASVAEGGDQSRVVGSRAGDQIPG